MSDNLPSHHDRRTRPAIDPKQLANINSELDKLGFRGARQEHAQFRIVEDMKKTDGHQQWRTHYSEKIGGGWLARLFGKPSGPKPQRPWPEMKHPRRIRASGFLPQPDGTHVHCTGYRIATPKEEEFYRLNNPEHGLHEEDLAAYRSAQRGTVVRFFAVLFGG